MTPQDVPSRSRHALSSALVVAVLALVGLVGVGGSAAAAPPAGTAYVRLAHLSPDTPQVDVYVGSVSDPGASFVVPGVGYGAVSPYQPLPVGSYVVSMRAAGAPADSPPVISATVEARPGAAYTIAGTGLFAGLGLTVLDDRLDSPPPGRANVRVINAAVSAPAVDVAPASGPPWATDVRFATTTDYRDCPLGDWNVSVSAAGREATTLPVKLDANSTYTVLLVDRNGGLAAELYRDSAGSGTVPLGGVETGFGGTASVGIGAAVIGALVAAVAGGRLTSRVAARRAGR